MNDWQELYNAAILETDWKTLLRLPTTYRFGPSSERE
jgi:hypothetical protein